MKHIHPVLVAMVALFSVLVSACATTGSGSPSAKPVLYPNATLERVGHAKAQEEVDACMDKAVNAGLTPDEKTNAVGRGAAKGAAVGGVAGSVGAIVRGKGVEGVIERGASSAVVGASVGAVAGAFNHYG
jgi:outer membrane lipoprotein SlyB